jgi:drug/metabolite transporter (DMT)-like permease
MSASGAEADVDQLLLTNCENIAILSFLFGVLVFSESCSPVRIAGVLLIELGVISLRSAF